MAKKIKVIFIKDWSKKYKKGDVKYVGKQFYKILKKGEYITDYMENKFGYIKSTWKKIYNKKKEKYEKHKKYKNQGLKSYHKVKNIFSKKLEEIKPKIEEDGIYIHEYIDLYEYKNYNIFRIFEIFYVNKIIFLKNGLLYGNKFFRYNTNELNYLLYKLYKTYGEVLLENRTGKDIFNDKKKGLIDNLHKKKPYNKQRSNENLFVILLFLAFIFSSSTYFPILIFLLKTNFISKNIEVNTFLVIYGIIYLIFFILLFLFYFFRWHSLFVLQYNILHLLSLFKIFMNYILLKIVEWKKKIFPTKVDKITMYLKKIWENTGKLNSNLEILEEKLNEFKSGKIFNLGKYMEKHLKLIKNKIEKNEKLIKELNKYIEDKLNFLEKEELEHIKEKNRQKIKKPIKKLVEILEDYEEMIKKQKEEMLLLGENKHYLMGQVEMKKLEIEMLEKNLKEQKDRLKVL